MHRRIQRTLEHNEISYLGDYGSVRFKLWKNEIAESVFKFHDRFEFRARNDWFFDASQNERRFLIKLAYISFSKVRISPCDYVPSIWRNQNNDKTFFFSIISMHFHAPEISVCTCIDVESRISWFRYSWWGWTDKTSTASFSFNENIVGGNWDE